MAPLILTIRGTPAPKGSKAFKGMGRRANGAQFARLVESSKKVKPWERAIARAVAAAAFEVFAGAVILSGEFLLARPASHGKKRIPAWSKACGDLDKLLRSTKDALTAAGVWHDDAQVIGYGRIVKRYCEPGEEPGAILRIEDPTPGLIKPQPKGKTDVPGNAKVGCARAPRRRSVQGDSPVAGGSGGVLPDLFAPNGEGSP